MKIKFGRAWFAWYRPLDCNTSSYDDNVKKRSIDVTVRTDFNVRTQVIRVGDLRNQSPLIQCMNFTMSKISSCSLLPKAWNREEVGGSLSFFNLDGTRSIHVSCHFLMCVHQDVFWNAPGTTARLSLLHNYDCFSFLDSSNYIKYI